MSVPRLQETDLLTPLREGVGDEVIEQLIIDAVAKKEAGHKINAADFVKPERNMSRIGGISTNTRKNNKSKFKKESESKNEQRPNN